MAPTYLDFAKEAIINLKERNGSSQAAIKKYIETNHPEVAFAQQHLRSALQRGVETGKLVKVKASFKLSAASRALELAKAKREAKAKKTPASGKDKDTKRPEDVARLTSELYDAVRAGDEVAVRDLIRRGADVNSTSQCATPLHTAVRFPNIIAVLLDHGANPNVGDEFNETTPLQLLAGFARLQNEIDSINLLIERGADLEFKDAHGQTAMHYAAGNHPGTVATMLLEKGACINAKDNVGHTPYYKALESKARIPRHAVAELLQEKGAEI